MKIRKAGIILKQNSSETSRIGAEMAGWFRDKSIEARIDRIDQDMDILVILGGDGTLLHVADQASRFRIPVVGVNLGSLGFLTEVEVGNRYEALEEILSGSAVIEDRLMLKTRLRRAGGDSEWRYALNDIVISKGNVDRLVRMEAWADEEFIASYKADGLIFSTPTGSTAYNLSAGGPIVHPGMHSILLTPICPFMLESRPVLLPQTLSLETRLAGPVNDVKVIVDGASAWEMSENDHLEVVAAENPLRLVCSPHKGYFEILRSKLNWGGRTIPD
ncbi:MAG: NAD(+)/NADH kinase [Proteobacteria bacterium]|nr:NAD(+)/NADH kinase [Pseudomonadota bacterium]MBU1738524.1 NAD(+)/NADH kinase [Pseudomonadota bacterium]